MKLMSKFYPFLFSLLLVTLSFGENKLKKMVAILPLETIGVQTSEGIKLTKMITEGLSSVPEIETISFDKVLDATKDSSVVKDSSCKNRVCQLAIGKKLYVEVIFAGSLYKVDNKYSLSLTALDIKKNTIIWSKDYSFDSEFNEFAKKVSYDAVIDSRSALFIDNNTTNHKSESSPVAAATQKENEISSQPNKPVVIDDVPVNKIEEDNDNDNDNSDVPSTEYDYNNGTVEKVAAGVNGRLAIGDLGVRESKWSAEGFVLYPTSKRSQIRARLSIPTSSSEEHSMNSSNGDNPDVMFSAEHEWGFRYFGVTLGLGYLYMRQFQEVSNGNVYDYKSDNIWNWVIGFRAGKSNRGFRARVSYPMPFVYDYNGSSNQNVFVEYSAFGMFGSDKFKGGVGVQGAFKSRACKYSKLDSTYSYYNYSYTYTTSDYSSSKDEFYVMVPCAKGSFLAGSHSVITLGIDLMGLFAPNVYGDSKAWSPNVSLGYTYSFAPLKRVDSFDGRF